MVTKRSVAKVFALPGLLLPVGIFTVDVLVGNSGLDIRWHDFAGSISITGIAENWYGCLLAISWVFHIVLTFKNRLPKKMAWVHVSASIVCLFGLYWLLFQTSLVGMPRRYYDYSYSESFGFLNSADTRLFIFACTFIYAQFMFWLYSVVLLWLKRSKRSGLKTLSMTEDDNVLLTERHIKA